MINKVIKLSSVPLLLLFAFLLTTNYAFSQRTGDYWERLIPGIIYNVTSITVDERNGNIWFIGRDRITSDRVYCYDGTILVNKGNPCSDPTNIVIALNGDVYVSNSENVFKLSNGENNWVTIFSPSNFTNAILIDNSSGAVYFGTNYYGFYRPSDNTWVTANNGLGNYCYISALALAPDGTIYAGTEYGVYRTTNLGTNWQPSSNFINTRIYGLAVIDNNIIFATTAGNRILRSMDGGVTWTQILQVTDTDFSVRKIIYNSKTEDLFAVFANAATIYRSTDLGTTWNNIANSSRLPISDIAFDNSNGANSGQVYMGSSVGLYQAIPAVVAVTQPALTFGQVTTGTSKTEYATIKNVGIKSGEVKSLEITEISAVTNNSSDNAFSLVDEYKYFYPIRVALYDSIIIAIKFSPNSSNRDYSGYVRIRHNGDPIDAYVSLIGTGISQDISVEDINEVPDTYSLTQNFPNPFNPSTKIKYTIKESGFVSLKVFDIFGREVTELVNTFQPNGNYEIIFDAKNLTSGVYYYRLNINDFTETKKMVLMK